MWMEVKALPIVEPASDPKIIDALIRALERARKYPVRSVSIALHLQSGGYETMEEFV